MTIQRPTLLALCLLALLPFTNLLYAQSSDSTAKDTPKREASESSNPRLLAARAKTNDCSIYPTRAEYSECNTANYQTRIVSLMNVTSQNEANEILVAVRNMFDPSLKVYLLNQTQVVLGTYPAALDQIEAFIHSLDRPHKSFRITYTVATVEDGKTIGTQHFTLVAADGQRTTLKEGDKVPVATGTFSTDNASAQTQFTYLDVGMNFDATATSLANGLSLKTKVEQSSIGPTNTIAGVAEPVVRQSVLETSTLVPFNKPVMLGSIDIPNSTRHLDVDVLIDLIK